MTLNINSPLIEVLVEFVKMCIRLKTKELKQSLHCPYADQLDVEVALLGCFPNVGRQLTESLDLLLSFSEGL